MMNNPLTHFNEEGRARMVDVSEKGITSRKAVATGKIYLEPETLRLINDCLLYTSPSPRDRG